MTGFSLPTREIVGFDASHFSEIVSRKSELRTLAELRADARACVEAVETYCLLGNDDIALVSVGKRGGKRIIWNFGGGV